MTRLPHERVDPERTASVYVHFPYCVERCRYCDFNVARKRVVPREAYADAVLAELALRLPEVAPRRLESLYFGGGTPSLWGAEAVGRVIHAVRAGFAQVVPDLEVTLEANPLEGDAATLEAFRAAGVTRLSLGVQSLSDPGLARLNRGHDARRALEALDAALAVGFESVSADLIFGLPGQSRDEFAHDVATILGRGVPHLSVYQLTLEPRTGLGAAAARGELELPSEDVTDGQWDDLHAQVAAFGLAPYETSNYARPGHWSRHNCGYWLGQPYLGLGAGAHSLRRTRGADGRVVAHRRENVRPHREYLDVAGSGRDPLGTAEALDAETHAFERLFTGLRYAPGVDLAALETELEVPVRAQYGRALAALTAQGLVQEGQGGRTALTARGRALSDGVFERLARAQRADADQEPPILRRATVPV